MDLSVMELNRDRTWGTIQDNRAATISRRIDVDYLYAEPGEGKHVFDLISALTKKKGGGTATHWTEQIDIKGYEGESWSDIVDAVLSDIAIEKGCDSIPYQTSIEDGVIQLSVGPSNA